MSNNKLYKAQQIIFELDKYGRNVAPVEYGLPIDPDHNDWDNKKSKEMVSIIEKILEND